MAYNYQETEWEDGKTALSADNMNKIEAGVKNANDFIDAIKTNIIDIVYPVGSIYMSASNVSPASFLGGTWEQIKDKFLLSAGSTYSAGAEGGEATHTITTSEMPSHTHTFKGTAVTSGTQSANHTHGIPALSGTAASAGAHTHSLNYATHVLNAAGNGDVVLDKGSIAYSRYATISMNEAGAHTHSVTTTASTSGGNSANHTHSVTATGSNSVAGGGNAMNNMPPYLAVYCWQRTA